MNPILKRKSSYINTTIDKVKSTKLFAFLSTVFHFFEDKIAILSKKLGISKSLVYKYSVPLFLISCASLVLFGSTMALLVKSNFNSASESINDFVGGNMETEISERLLKELEAHEVIVDGELNAWVEKAATIAQSPAFFSGDLINISLYCKELIKNNNDLLEIIVLDKEGAPKYSSFDPISSNFDGQAHAFDPIKIIDELNSKSEYKSTIILNPEPNFSYIQVGYPIVDHKGDLQEGLILICKMNLFDKIEAQESESYLALNHDAEIMSVAKGGITKGDAIGGFYSDKYSLDEQTKEKGNFTSLNGENLISYSKSKLGVTFLSEIPVDKALAIVQENKANTQKVIGGSLAKILKYIALLAFFIIAFASLIGFLLARSIVKPINKLMEGTVEIANGNYGQELKVGTEDEIGDLTEKFNLMTNTLANQEGNLEIHNETIQNQTEKLAMSNAELEQYAKTISNDLKEPLKNIGYYQSMLKSSINNHSNSQKEMFLDKINESVQTMSKMIEDLFSYAQYNKQLENCILTRTELNSLVDVALKNLNYKLINNKADVDIEQLPFVEVQAPLIISLFQNLISNCISNRIDSKKLQINIYAELLENKYWRINIEDNGKGYNEDESKTLFTVFRQLSSSHDMDMTYGLAHCRKIILYHGGKIGVESTPGLGTTYYFTLPATTKKQLVAA